MHVVPASQLIDLLTEARARTLELVGDLSDAELIGPQHDIVNPLLWEIGHVAWFQEQWVLRHHGRKPPVRRDADALWDSAAVAHDTRWHLGLPPRADTLAYMRRVLEDAVAQVAAREPGPELTYFCPLALFHEDMHTEAFTYTRQTLGYWAPRLGIAPAPPPAPGGPLPGDVEVPGGPYVLGATPDGSFIFDNEKWAHPVQVAPFAIARAPVTNAEFAAFVDDGGYRRRELWSDEGWQWRERAGGEHPVYWQPEGAGVWCRRHFDRAVPLEAHHPVIHVNWHEAEAWCRWAGRRLPTEAEWELAASAEPTADGRSLTGRRRRYPWGDEPPGAAQANTDWRAMGTLPVDALPAGDSAFGVRQMIGNVWEWTATDFGPYPGFVPDAYKEYSEPWFTGHKVLRGGCWTTRARLIRNTWRNFYPPHRRDVWAGFRTCAPAVDARRRG